MACAKHVALRIVVAFSAIGMLMLASAPAGGSVILSLSQSSSDSTPAEYLKATLDFDVTGDMLTLSVTNNTADPAAYYINRVYFNASPMVTGLALAGPSDWSLKFAEDGIKAAPFGNFDVGLVGGVGNAPNEVAPGESLTFTIKVLGTGPFSATDFTSELSSVWGGQIPSLAAMKFIRGPGDDSARGNATIGAQPMPEPATVSFVGAGLVGVWLMSRRRGRGGASGRAA
jgi:hypothetical protein